MSQVANVNNETNWWPESNYKKHLTIILGDDNDLHDVVSQTYHKVKMS